MPQHLIGLNGDIGIGYFSNGYGYTQRNVNTPDYGLYYMWIYLAGNNVKNLYGYILVDNLQPEIALDSISLPKTDEVELGKTLTLTPTFSPVNTTNKIVTWSSSDESVATVDNAGKITPKKIGSTIITVTSQDGNKKAFCTVTVTQPNTSNNNNNDNNNSTTQDTKQYVTFPMMIINGKGNLHEKNYDGDYKLYYQFVEVNDTQYANIEKLQEQLKNNTITYEDYLSQYNKLLPAYNESKWVETKDGSFEKNLTEFTGTKKFALWAKLVMQDKTVYEASVYTMNGNGSANNNTNDTTQNNITANNNNNSNNPNNNNSSKDSTVAGGKIPQTGATLTLALVIVSVVGIGIIAFKKYNSLRDI